MRIRAGLLLMVMLLVSAGLVGCAGRPHAVRNATVSSAKAVGKGTVWVTKKTGQGVVYVAKASTNAVKSIGKKDMADPDTLVHVGDKGFSGGQVLPELVQDMNVFRRPDNKDEYDLSNIYTTLDAAQDLLGLESGGRQRNRRAHTGRGPRHRDRRGTRSTAGLPVYRRVVDRAEPGALQRAPAREDRAWG